METIRCTFYRSEQVSIAEFQQIVDKLAADYEICRRNESDPETFQEIKDRIKTKTVQNSWGEDYTAEVEAVIQLSNAHS